MCISALHEVAVASASVGQIRQYFMNHRMPDRHLVDERPSTNRAEILRCYNLSVRVVTFGLRLSSKSFPMLYHTSRHWAVLQAQDVMQVDCTSSTDRAHTSLQFQARSTKSYPPDCLGHRHWLKNDRDICLGCHLAQRLQTLLCQIVLQHQQRGLQNSTIFVCECTKCCRMSRAARQCGRHEICKTAKHSRLWRMTTVHYAGALSTGIRMSVIHYKSITRALACRVTVMPRVCN